MIGEPVDFVDLGMAALERWRLDDRTLLCFAGCDVSQELVDLVTADGEISRVSFREARFVTPLSFAGLRFATGIDLSDAAFAHAVDFSGISVHPDRMSMFLRTRFGSTTTFNHATFGKYVDFQDARFEADTSFADANLGAKAKFWRTTFAAAADLSDVQLGSSLTRFEEAHFHGPATLLRLAGKKLATLRFIECHFHDLVNATPLPSDIEFETTDTTPSGILAALHPAQPIVNPLDCPLKLVVTDGPHTGATYLVRDTRRMVWLLRRLQLPAALVQRSDNDLSIEVAADSSVIMMSGPQNQTADSSDTDEQIRLLTELLVLPDQQ